MSRWESGLRADDVSHGMAGAHRSRTSDVPRVHLALKPIRCRAFCGTPGGTRTPNLLIRSQCGRGAVSLVIHRNRLCCLRIRFSTALVVSHCFSTSRGPTAAQRGWAGLCLGDPELLGHCRVPARSFRRRLDLAHVDRFPGVQVDDGPIPQRFLQLHLDEVLTVIAATPQPERLGRDDFDLYFLAALS